jgi:hypothetical protein
MFSLSVLFLLFHVLYYRYMIWKQKMQDCFCDLLQVGGFLQGTQFSSFYKTDRHDITEILLKVALDKKNTNK